MDLEKKIERAIPTIDRTPSAVAKLHTAIDEKNWGVVRECLKEGVSLYETLNGRDAFIASKGRGLTDLLEAIVDTQTYHQSPLYPGQLKICTQGLIAASKMYNPEGRGISDEIVDDAKRNGRCSRMFCAVLIGCAAAPHELFDSGLNRLVAEFLSVNLHRAAVPRAAAAILKGGVENFRVCLTQAVQAYLELPKNKEKWREDDSGKRRAEKLLAALQESHPFALIGNKEYISWWGGHTSHSLVPCLVNAISKQNNLGYLAPLAECREFLFNLSNQLTQHIPRSVSSAQPVVSGAFFKPDSKISKAKEAKSAAESSPPKSGRPVDPEEARAASETSARDYQNLNL